jgi:aryl-alcohol dehydrogenase-like predicted oxidoreductase
MNLRRLGGSGLATSPIGFNAVSFTVGCGAVDAAEAAAILAQLLETRRALVDVTDLSGSGTVDAFVGRAVRGRRDDIVLASRAGASYSAQGRLAAVDAHPASLIRTCDATLRRLDTDHLDVYYLDRVDPQVPVEQSVQALATLVEAGKVRHIGLSHVDADQLRRAHAVHPVASVATEYSLLERAAEGDLLPTARSLGVGLVAYSPLGRGLLTGTLTSLAQVPSRDYRRADPWFRPANFRRARALAQAAEALAARRHLSVGRLALAWLLGQGEDIVALPGTRSLTHLEMNLAAADVVLSPQDRAELAALLEPRPVAG